MEQGRALSEHCSAILPRLLLGDMLAAQDAVLLSDQRVSRIVDLSNLFGGSGTRIVTDGLTPPVHSRLEVCVDDRSTEDISWAFDAIDAFIAEAEAAGEVCLVHCFEGRSRSATAVVAHLMRAHSLTLRQAYEHTKNARHAVQPNDGFKRALMDLEAQLRPGEPPSLEFNFDRRNRASFGSARLSEM